MSTIVQTGIATPSLPGAGRYKYFTNVAGDYCSIDSTGAIKVYAVGVTPEQVEDIVGSFITSSTTITVTYFDAGNSMTFDLVQSSVDHAQISNRGTNTHAQIDTHIGSSSNPHGTTAAQVGAYTTTQTDNEIDNAISVHELSSDPHPQYLTSVEGNAAYAALSHTHTAAQITDFNTAADGRITAQKGVANGLATLDATVKVPVAQIPALPYAPASHTHTSSEITDFATSVETVGDSRYSLLSHTHADATISTSGFMSAADKVKLDGITSDVALRSTTQYNNTSNATYVTCPQLAVNCVAGRLYYAKWMLRHTAAAAATGFRHGLGGTATGTVNFTGTVLGSTTGSTGAEWQAQLVALNTNTLATSSTGTSASIAVLEGIFICTTNGQIYPQFLSETNGTQVSLLVDSLCIYKELL